MSVRDALDLLQADLGWLPDWLISAAILIAPAVAALLVHRTAVRWVRQLVPPHREFLQSLIAAADGLIRLGLVIVAVAVVLPVTPMPAAARMAVAHGLVVAFILLLGWSATATIGMASDFYLRRSSVVQGYDVLARKHVTQVRVLRRVAGTLVVIVTAAAALMTFDSVRQYGVSLIASAGAAGLVVGLAARPLLANLFAGIQIAVSQPIRIDDVVVLEGEYGVVEEITGTYVVVKLWDRRRMVVPLSYFLEKPFQNWTRQSTDLIGTVLLWVDYSVPVARVRARLEEIVRESRLWDAGVVNLQVVDSSERAVQLRALVSARTSDDAWDLRCEVREKLIVFLQSEYPAALPKQRAELIDFRRLSGRSDKRDAA
ncbi:MAG: mechanosensitive ion channel [Alphaproteobacteria bacterium]|nr:mechanosensitive ion channel [Alphaproteobacteria bacterium]MBV8406061.1 mechanosensitive ion channel [Alphaproteobacteria bacterium]